MTARGLEGVGVDRISASFPVRDYPARDAWDVITETAEGGQRFSKIMRHGKASVAVSVARLQTGEMWGRVDFNPARFADPDGCSLLPLEEAPAGLAAGIEVARLVGVKPRGGAERLRLTRLDVARDFRGVAAPSAYVAGLAGVRRPYARRSGVWSDAAKGSAQTLHVGSGAGMVRLYDQYEAYAEKGAVLGSLRFEVEARKGWLRDRGITGVDGLAPAALEVLLGERWEWSRMGEAVSGTAGAARVFAAAVQRGELTAGQARAFAGALLMESGGIGHGLEPRQARRYRAFLREHGISAVIEGVPEAHYVGRLDFATGTEVAA